MLAVNHEVLPVQPPKVSSQADAVASGQRIAADAQRKAAKILSHVVTVAEQQTAKVQRIDRLWVPKSQRNTPVREPVAVPGPRRLPTYADLRAKLRDLNDHGWRASYSEARVNCALGKLDSTVKRAQAEVEEVIAQASRELLALSCLYGDDSPMWQGVYTAILVNGPRGLQFDLTCEAARKMVKERGADQPTGSYRGDDGKEHAVPNVPRAMTQSLNAAVDASSSIADSMRKLTNRAHRIAFLSWIGHGIAFWRDRNAEPTRALACYAKAEEQAFASVNAALAGATRAVAAWQGLYPAASDFFIGALDAVHPNKTMYESFKESAKAPKALVRNRGDRALADASAPGEVVG
ncbi:MAG TPA: hypothetical protein VLC93_08560 [Myxococcota bacterium]|nr:hypothetical protein [Myxococcota bacterium]